MNLLDQKLPAKILLELHSTLRMEVISQHFNVKQGLNSCAVHNVWENMCANKNQNVGVHIVETCCGVTCIHS